MASLPGLPSHRMEVWEENAVNKTNELWQCAEEHRAKAIKMLMKILSNIQANPGVEKYQNIIFAKMMKAFRNARPGLHILFAAGFEQTVDGSKIIFKAKHMGRLQRVLEILTNKIANPDPVPPQKSQAAPKKKPAEKKMDVDPEPAKKPVAKKKPKSQLSGIDLELGEAVVLFGDEQQAQTAAAEYNGAEIDGVAITVTLFLTEEEKKAADTTSAAEAKPVDDGAAADANDQEMAEPASEKPPATEAAAATPASCKVKITGLTANVTKPTLKTLLSKLPSGYLCAVSEVLYRKKRGRGEALGGGDDGDFEVGDDLMANIRALKGDHTRIGGKDLQGMTAEEKKEVIEQKRQQYRQDKSNHKFKESISRQKNDNASRKAALELKRKNEQYQMERALREKKREKERAKAAKAKIRAKIKADKERRARLKAEKEKAKAGK